MRFLITYDLRKPGRDYQSLWNSLKESGAVRLLESVWYMKGNYTAIQLRDHFWQFMDSNDRLLVVRFDDWASYNAIVNIT